MTESFTAGNERITFVPGWQPIPRGSGVFKEKIRGNEFFSYRELHRAMNKSNATHSLKSIFDELLEEEEVPTSSSAEKDHICLLDLNIMHTQFFALYSQMYPQHAISHRDHENSLYHMIQQCKPIAQVLEYDDFV